jgi:hypothetical protein
MALTKQNVDINFSQGVDTKTDPYQVPIGKFLALVNSIFLKGNLLTKRNGYGPLASLPDSTSTFATTFNGALTAIGTKLEAYSSGYMQWSNKGNIQPIALNTLPLIRNNTTQSQVDTAISSNGLICTVYTDQDPTNLGASIYRYAIADVNTGQNIVAPTTIATADASFGTPRVFLLGNYFVIVYTNKVSSTYHLKFFAISIFTPTTVTSPVDISTSYTPSTTVNFDGVVFNGSLYLAWNGASASGVKMAFISSSLAVSSSTNPDSSHQATLMSLTADAVNGNIWVSYYDSGTTNGYSLAVNQQLSSVLSAHQTISSVTVANITSSASSGTLTVLYEVSNNYSYDSSIPTNFSRSITVTQSGTVGSPATILRSVGLASKSFILNSTIYCLFTYQSPYQNTYFLANVSGNIVAKLAYGNGQGYLTLGLPSVTVSGSQAQLGYLFKDLVQAVNKNTNVPAGSQVAGIYSQLGINLASFDFSSSKLFTAEIGTNLNISGGFLWAYDGYMPVEQGFHLWPDSVEVSTNAAAVTPTGTVTSGSNVITAVSSMAGVGIGASVSGTAIPSNQKVISFTSNTITFGPLVATGTHVAEAITVTGNISTAQQYFYQFTYEWTDNQGNAFRSAPSIPVSVTTTGTTSTNTITLPTLRLTYKTANPVKIVGYRWSAAQESYYQFTSISYPTLNDTTIDSVTVVDSLADSTILGNNLLYTTGGVLENSAGPAFDSVFIFDDRLFGISSEDKNLLVYSKQVIEGTPVEMSDLLTLYVAPNIGAQGSTGPLVCGVQMDDKAILFKATAINYIAGTGPDNTGANSQYTQPIFITSTVGCSNQKSIVFQPQGIMFEFASEAGNQIWLLGRDLTTRYIGAEVEGYTQNATVQSAVNIPGTNQVRFTMSSGITLMYDYYYGQWGTFLNVPAVSSTIYQGLHTYINSFGQVFQESPGIYLDNTSPVLMSFVTAWIKLAGLQGYQRAYFFTLLGTYYSPHKLDIRVAYDYNPNPTSQTIITPSNFTPAYGNDLTYGSGTPYGGQSVLEQRRIFFQQQRCESFQLIVNEIYDPSYGVVAGKGLTLSGIDLIVGVKKGWRPYKAASSTGAS